MKHDKNRKLICLTCMSFDNLMKGILLFLHRSVIELAGIYTDTLIISQDMGIQRAIFMSSLPSL